MNNPKTSLFFVGVTVFCFQIQSMHQGTSSFASKTPRQPLSQPDSRQYHTPRLLGQDAIAVTSAFKATDHRFAPIKLDKRSAYMPPSGLATARCTTSVFKSKEQRFKDELILVYVGSKNWEPMIVRKKALK